MKRAGILSVALAFVLLIVAAGVGHAAISGQIWENDGSNTATTVPSSLWPNAQFTTNAINYDSSVGGYYIAGFLNNPTFTNLQNGFNSSDSVDNVHIRFTGQAYLNAGVNNFSVTHDDGLVLTMGGGIGTVVYEPGATSPVTTYFHPNAPSAGYYSFTLDYNECCGPPAVLQWQVNGAPPVTTPLPGTVLLIGPGLAGLIGLKRKWIG